MRIAGIEPESIVDGPGIRWTVFAQGCGKRCPGCHNPATWDPNGGTEMSAEELTAMFRAAIDEDPLIAGVTLSGGEPMDQAAEMLPFARAVKAAGKDLWLYTGWTEEELRERGDVDELALLDIADTVVDGRFVQELRTLDLPFVGSSNQRIIKKRAV